jgi:ferredoxin, 2Fe-2S
MITITFIDHLHQARDVEVEAGGSLMQAAVNHGITGIVAECGGACSCATCLCYVDEAWAQRVGPATGMEQEMLDGTLEARPTSRLACQIRLAGEMDGLVVHVPESQY